MKKFTAILLALVLTFALSLTAFATDPAAASAGDADDFDADNTQATVVSIKTATDGDGSDANQLSATVPIAVTLAVKANGDIIGPDNYTVTNTSAMPIKITSVAVATSAGFTVTAAGAGSQIGLITMSNSKDTPAAPVTLRDWNSAVSGASWNLTADGITGNSITITFGGSVSGITQDITDGVAAFTITYTIASGAHAA